MFGSRSIAVAATVSALAGADSIVQPAAAEDGIVCTASSDCGSFESYAAEFCYWGVYGYIEGTLVIFVDWNSNAKTDPQPSNDAVEYCESGF